jgi:HlyD family secretion protein
MNKAAKIVVAVALLGGIGAVAGFSAWKRNPKAVEVRIEAVELRDLVASVTAPGQVRPQNKVDVATDITGKIVRLAVVEGQMVTKGQFLLEIDGQQAEAAVQRAEASLSSAKAHEAQTRANSIQTERSYARSLEIRRISPTLVSDEQMEQLKTSAEVSKAVHEASQYSVKQAEATLRDARASLEKTKLYAPMAGRVTRLNVAEGETAIMTLNKDAATLLTISDMSVLETRVRVNETDVARISIGDSAEVQIDAFPDTSFVGRVTRISNSSVRGATAALPTGDQAIDYEVVIQLVNPNEHTRPDFSATARIITAEEKGVLAIPIIALTVRENTPVGGDTAVGLGRPAPRAQMAKRDVDGVFVVDSANTVTFRPVKVGITGDEYFQVTGGLRAGERIVAGTFQAIRDLKDGTVVRDIKADSADTKGATKAARGS